MSINLAINGFGRIGRNVLRQIYKTGQDKDVKVVAINDLTDAKTLAHLLKYDSVHRKFDADIKAEENALVVIISDSNVPSDKPFFSTNRFLIISNGESVFTTKLLPHNLCYWVRSLNKKFTHFYSYPLNNEFKGLL